VYFNDVNLDDIGGPRRASSKSAPARSTARRTARPAATRVAMRAVSATPPAPASLPLPAVFPPPAMFPPPAVLPPPAIFPPPSAHAQAPQNLEPAQGESEDGTGGADETTDDPAGQRTHKNDLSSPAAQQPSAGAPEDSSTPERPRPAQADFEAFFESHHRELGRLAFLLIGNKEDAEDITADALTSAWLHWDRVQAAENSLAYVRRSVANLAASQVRRRVRQRNLLTRVSGQRENPTTSEPDVPQALHLQWALDQLPTRKRQCVVLRYALDLSEAETADWLGVSVGTVKSQTSKAVSELERLLSVGGSGAGAPEDGGRHQREPSRAGTRGSRKTSGRRRQGHANGPSEPTRTAFMRLRGGEA